MDFGNKTRSVFFAARVVTRLRRSALVAVLLGAPFGAGPSHAEDPQIPVCRLILLEEQTDLEDLELDLDLARSEAVAMEQIFKLVDSLFKKEAIERIVFLRAKHDYDVARLAVDEGRLRVAKQEALVEQYRWVCDAIASGRTSDQGEGDVDAAHERHREAECGLLNVRAETAAVDLEYSLEVLASVMDLRKHDVATRQDVILAEMNVEMAEKRLKETGQRAKRCREPGKPPG
jgi:hypothetical protein